MEQALHLAVYLARRQSRNALEEELSIAGGLQVDARMYWRVAAYYTAQLLHLYSYRVRRTARGRGSWGSGLARVRARARVRL